MTISINENHVSLASEMDIKSLSKDFLHNRKLTHFSYCRFDRKQKTLAGLTTHAELYKDYILQQFYNTTAYDKQENSSRPLALLWDGYNNQDRQFIQHARDYYNLDHGLTISPKDDSDIKEFFFFGAHANNSGVNNYYLANFDEFYNFIFYFKEYGSSLLKQAIHNAIKLEGYNPDLFAENPQQYPANEIIINIREPMFKKLYYDKHLKAYLSKREFQCLNGLAMGLRCKDIAKNLGLTEHSVRFYLENLKQKIGIRDHAALVNFYHQLF